MVTPGVVIAATSSGSGKTTIATGLIAALARRMTVAPFKVGPDYIDPGYHGLAAGSVGRNLDSVLCGAGLIGPLYAHGSAHADFSVVEGVMGLFDGRIVQDQPQHEIAQGSTAEIAAALHMPVILVLDVRGMSQSVGAVARGFATMHPQVHIAGVILNKVGSPRHAAVCQEAVAAHGIPVLGAIPRVDNAEVPSRHLGLVTSAELDQSQAAIQAMADMVSTYVDIDAIVQLGAAQVEQPAWRPEEAVPAVGEARIALAGGPAFSFTYAEHVELLKAAGATVIDFDPLHDALPPCDGLIIPGGFPEEHSATLGNNHTLRAQISHAIAQGMPVHAECAGLLWLLTQLNGQDMLGVIPTSAKMGARLTLGYREAVALHDSVAYQAGQRVIGHEFHQTALSDATLDGWHSAWGWRSWENAPVVEGFVANNIHASYLHVHPAGVPQSVERFVQHCVEWKQQRAGV